MDANHKLCKYKETYPNELIAHMSKGLSFLSFAGVISVSKQTLYNWMDEFEEFADAREVGEAKCLLFWEQLGTGGAAGKVPYFNQAAYKMQVQHRFRGQWSDRIEVDHGGQKDNPVQIEQETRHLVSFYSLPDNGRHIDSPKRDMLLGRETTEAIIDAVFRESDEQDEFFEAGELD